jgi:hypothetical protein
VLGPQYKIRPAPDRFAEAKALLGEAAVLKRRERRRIASRDPAAVVALIDGQAMRVLDRRLAPRNRSPVSSSAMPAPPAPPMKASRQSKPSDERTRLVGGGVPGP